LAVANRRVNDASSGRVTPSRVQLCTVDWARNVFFAGACRLWVPGSTAGWAWYVVNIASFAIVLIVAYRHNRDDYRDTGRSALLWALALAAIWPITVIAWFVARCRYSTPMSPRRH
jgi:hypothetical protein